MATNRDHIFAGTVVLAEGLAVVFGIWPFSIVAGLFFWLALNGYAGPWLARLNAGARFAARLAITVAIGLPLLVISQVCMAIKAGVPWNPPTFHLPNTYLGEWVAAAAGGLGFFMWWKSLRDSDGRHYDRMRSAAEAGHADHDAANRAVQKVAKQRTQYTRVYPPPKEPPAIAPPSPYSSMGELTRMLHERDLLVYEFEKKKEMVDARLGIKPGSEKSGRATRLVERLTTKRTDQSRVSIHFASDASRPVADEIADYFMLAEWKTWMNPEPMPDSKKWRQLGSAIQIEGHDAKLVTAIVDALSDAVFKNVRPRRDNELDYLEDGHDYGENKIRIRVGP